MRRCRQFDAYDYAAFHRFKFAGFVQKTLDDFGESVANSVTEGHFATDENLEQAIAEERIQNAVSSGAVLEVGSTWITIKGIEQLRQRWCSLKARC